jgi:outer membrane protein assembly complex protein YaeT
MERSIGSGVEKVDSRLEVQQHKALARLGQLRFLRPFLSSAALVAALYVPALAQEGLVVRQVVFEGNRAIDDYTLSTVIATTRSSWFARSFVRFVGLGEKRHLDELEFRRDVVRLLLFYRQSGYMGAVVDTFVRRTSKDAFIRFRIHEGEPVRVRRFDLTGFEGVFNIERRRGDLPLHVGDPFNRFLFQASADSLVSWLNDLGYPYAEVFRSLDADAGLQLADVALEAVPGLRMRVGRVDIEGVKAFDTSDVRSMLSVSPGDLLTRERLYQSQRDLYAMGVFRTASVSLMDSVPGGPADTLGRVLVRVTEGPRHRVRAGVGYATLECLRLQAGWTAVGFLGGVRSLEVTGRLANIGVGYPLNAGFQNNICPYLDDPLTSDTLTYSLNVTWRQPVFLSPRHTARIGVFAERRSEYQVYNRDAVGFNVGATFNARRTVPVTLSYNFSVGRTQARPEVYCSIFQACTADDQAALATRRRFASVTLAALRDRTNSPVDPTRGNVVALTLTHASRFVGSDAGYAFNRAELEIARFHPLSRRTVFAWRVKGGTILPETFALSGQAARYVPPDQRFYAGGPNSVRGFRLNDLGPRVYVTSDTTNFTVPASGDTLYADLRAAPTGGNSIVLANAELRFPSPVWPQWVRLGLFVDVGQVFERGSEPITIDRFRLTPGVGVRIATPLGPARLDLAYNPYGSERGPLIYSDSASSTLQVIRPAYTNKAGPPRRFVDRLVFQFAVGQAF